MIGCALCRSKKASEPSSLGQYILLKMAAVDPVTAFAARTLILSTLAAYAWHQHDVTVGVWCPVPMLVASDVISTCGFVRSFGGHSIHSRESCPVLPRHPHQADDQRLPHCPPVVVPDCAIPSLLLLVSMGNAVLSNLFLVIVVVRSLCRLADTVPLVDSLLDYRNVVTFVVGYGIKCVLKLVYTMSLATGDTDDSQPLTDR